MTTILFDDTYKGQRFTYQLNYRPLDSANVPAGWIIFSNRPGSTEFGTVDYPFRLTDEQANTYQLTLITK